MPVQPTFPGVYIEELPSGVRTITGVATSITAFIGQALRGPVDKAITINNFGDFERIFGGLWLESSMSFAVRNFYLNGGSQAVIVRLFHSESGNNAKRSKSRFKIGGFTFEAAYEGKWGIDLRGSIDTDVSDEVAKRMGLAEADLFNLTITDTGNGVSEQFRNLSVKDSVRRIDKVLEAESKLVRWEGTWPPDPLPTIAVGDDEVKTAEKELADAERVLQEAEKALAAAEAENPPDQSKIDAATQARDTAKTARDDKQTVLDTKKNYTEATDGEALVYADFNPSNAKRDKKGLFALDQADLFNLLCIAHHNADGTLDTTLVGDAAKYCEDRRAMLLVDPPATWTSKTKAKDEFTDPNDDKIGTRSKNAVLFFPMLRQRNPLRDNQFEDFAPCGAAAGIFARTDAQRGVWKAPAGLEAALNGVPQLSVSLTDDENGELNPLGMNCLRAMPAAGRVIWGARTLQGNDRLASEWKYIPVRRTALFIEESLYRGTQWVVFEPNDEPTWAQIRLNLGAFMQNLFRQGAFQGGTPKESYLVKCDSETTTQNDIDLGIVNILVGFAPLKPAEFVIIKIQQLAGQIEV